MGRRSQSTQPGAYSAQQPQKWRPCHSPHGSKDITEDLAELHTTWPPTAKLVGQEKLTPATKQDIADLLQEMRQVHAADLDLLWT
ncbi:Hypothetical predicted protein [Pelobates cultripes]|uniref:Uncharacterized protein n=1 Tax=Pelobates cultripes TaxID=61616 RepID=A0AAD1VZM8_PELCU|nr:Hypothetical predicted protein [Pelobates cultripes]